MKMTYVWIAIAIISWIYKIVKKNRQEEASKIPQVEFDDKPVYEKPKLNIEDLLKDLVQKETPIQPVYVKETNENSKRNTVSQNIQKNIEVKKDLKNEEEFSRFKEFELSNVQSNNNLNIREKLQNIESAKEAFIMSEIFSKKY